MEHVQGLNEYQNIAMGTAIYPGADQEDNQLAIYYTALGLAGEAGEVANKVKKILRDDNGVLTDEKRAAIKKEIGGVLWYCATLSRELGLDLAEVATTNAEQLASRALRGKIKGSGDER